MHKSKQELKEKIQADAFISTFIAAAALFIKTKGRNNPNVR
jgi:hypothetical protein